MHPELVRFSVFGIERAIYSYGVFVILGIALGLVVAVMRARGEALAPFDVLAAGLFAVAGGLCGGVLLYVAVHVPMFLADPSLWRQPGLVFYGGLIGGAGGAALYCRVYSVPLWRFADAAAPGLALGHAFGRVGCLLAGCCYGRIVAPSFPFAVELAGAWRHPVQLYEATGLLVIAAVTTLLPRRHKGAIFAVYLGAYAVLRLTMERFRGDDFERGSIPGLRALSTSQAIAAAMLVAAVALLYLMVRPSNRKGAA
jgi:phosphatidylglycerol:prolipoprotein diacylglycerol transferase